MKNLEDFRTYRLAVAFYRHATALKLPAHLKNQLNRAASSISCNLAEGRGKPTRRDQLKFFSTAFGSARECQVLLILADLRGSEAWQALDAVAASLYRLRKRAR